MRSPIRTAALSAAAMLLVAGCVPILLAGCVTSKQAWERAARIDEIHRHAPEFIKLNWDRYLTQANGRYGIFALDKNMKGVGWIYCVQACNVLFGNQQNAVKSAWAFRAIDSCEQAVRRDHPMTRADCDVYAIRDEIVWEGRFPWK